MPVQAAGAPAAAAESKPRLHKAEAEVRAKSASWVAPVGRIGLATQGVLYIVVAILALQVASGHENEQPAPHGAVETVAAQPFGGFLLLVLAIGLALHAVWRFTLAARGDGSEDGAKDVGKRVAQLGRGLLYAGLAVLAFATLFHARQAEDSGNQTETLTADVLDWPGGPVLIAAIGVAVAGAGVWQARKAVTRKFADDLDLSRCREPVRTGVIAVGVAGIIARGIAFLLVGWFLVVAAWDHNPGDAGGLDGALLKVAQSEHGPGLLRILAVGLMLFGAYRLLDACFRTREGLAEA